MNIGFCIHSSVIDINLVCNYGTKIKDVLELFLKRVGKPKNNYYFMYKGLRLNYNDERAMENVFSNGAVVKAVNI